MKFNSRNQLRQLRRPVESSPPLLGAQTELEDHRQRRLAGEVPRVLAVRSRTVAKVDSIGLVVRRCTRRLPQNATSLRVNFWHDEIN